MTILRPVAPGDIEAFYEHQADPDAARMALFPPRDRVAHAAHWQRTLRDERATTRTIEHDGEAVGFVASWPTDDGERLVGYFIGPAHWGRGHATAGLAELLHVVTERPLHAHVATSNVGSIRVLEKCGFERTGVATTFDERLGQAVTEAHYRLD